MSSNHMKEVAKLLGIELGEEFNIKGAPKDWFYKITDVSVFMYDVKTNKKSCVPHLLIRLLTGKDTIIKLPEKPAMHNPYYYPLPSDIDLWECCTWTDSNEDVSRLSRGLVFKTKEEAIEMAKKMLTVAKEV